VVHRALDRPGLGLPPFTTSDHNYDHGTLYIEADGHLAGDRAHRARSAALGHGRRHGDVDQPRPGRLVAQVKQLTRNSRYNHTYARQPVNADPGFYAFWADGSPLEATPSSLYFATKDGRVSACRKR
jgi:hypothetical protein